MAEEKKLQSWRYGPGGEVKLFDSDADLPKGWFDHPSLVPEEPSEDISALRAAYKEMFGKKAFPGWDEATLREKIAAGPE